MASFLLSCLCRRLALDPHRRRLVPQRSPLGRYRRLRFDPLEERRLLALSPVLVKDINVGGGASNPENFVAVGGLAFFSASDGVNGVELWRSDGTSAGTVLVKNINPSGDSNPKWLANVGGVLYFQADDGASGAELWRSDGTSSGTVIVRDIVAGGFGSYPNSLANVNGTLFFAARADSGGNMELWKSDGTSSGTVLVRDIQPGSGGSYPSVLTNVGGVLFFQANDGVTSTKLWKSDGTSSGTMLVRDIAPGDFSSPADFVNVNGVLFFRARTAATGFELWKSDGTSSGTVLVRDIRPGPLDGLYSSGAFRDTLTNVNGILYFRANDSTGFEFDTGYELWKSDGTSSGTVLVRDIRAGMSGSYPVDLRNVNGTLMFRANDGSTGYEFWRSDGTSSGTVLVRDITPGISPVVPNPSFPANVGGTLYFRASNITNGYELWQSDGTSGGTVLTGDINPFGSSSPAYMTNIAGTLYLQANDGATGRELYRLASDSTPTVNLSLAGSPLAENGGVATVSATLSATSSQSVTVNLAFTGTATRDSDYAASATSIVITSGNTIGSILLTGLDDVRLEDPETIVVDIALVVGGNENGVQRVTARIIDDDAFQFPASRVLRIGSTVSADNLKIVFRETTFRVTIDGVTGLFDIPQTFNIADFDRIEHDGGGGNDRVRIYSPPGPAEITLRPTTIDVDAASLDLALTDIETGYVYGGPNDSALFHDSAGNDRFTGRPRYSVMAGTGYFIEAIGVGTVRATATTGRDTAILLDGPGDDSLRMTPAFVSQTGTGYSLRASGFDAMYGRSRGEGNDTAVMTDSAGDDTFNGRPDYSLLVAGGAFLEAIGYDTVIARATGGGQDSAVLYDSPGNDQAILGPARSLLSGEGFVNRVEGFDRVYARADFGGVDQATLADDAGNDRFFGYQEYALLVGAEFLLHANNFEVVQATASLGDDRALLVDGPGDDTLAASGNQATLTYGNGRRIAVEAFDAVFAVSRNGGTNRRSVVEPLAFNLVFDGPWVSL